MTKYGTTYRMAIEGQTQNQSSDTASSSDPAFVAPQGTSEQQVQTITSHKLNGHNYLQWSQSVMMFVCDKGKDDHLTRSIMIPKPQDPSNKSWKANNNMVISWLINSMVNNIAENFLILSTASKIWNASRDSYSNSDNISKLFSVENVLADLW